MTPTRLILPLLFLTATLAPADDSGLPPGAISPEEAYTPAQQARQSLRQLSDLYAELTTLLSQTTDEASARNHMGNIDRLRSRIHAFRRHLEANPDLRQAIESELTQSPETARLLREQENRYHQEAERCRQAGLLPANFLP